MRTPQRILVTGGAGFIGSALVRNLLDSTEAKVLNLDALTYAANLLSLQDVETNDRYQFVRCDIRDAGQVREVFAQFRPDTLLHLAAESHVDRSLAGPMEFVQTNVVGTSILLQASREHFETLSVEQREQFVFIHVSTDEVFGSLGDSGKFQPDTPYDPSSPYSASKAASDHLARAWQRSFGLPVIITNCSNNYGPRQFPEKLVPLMILHALEGKRLPVYGTGDNVRDWLHVEDHAAALHSIAAQGTVGKTYLIGGGAERTNLEVVQTICGLVDELAGPLSSGPRASLIEFVEDRPGHDFRYAIDDSATRHELSWQPKHHFESGLRNTVQWYLNSESWVHSVRSGEYLTWMEENYAWR